MKELPETVFYEDFEFDDIDEEEEYDLNGGGDFSEYMWMGEEEDFDRKVNLILITTKTFNFAINF